MDKIALLIGVTDYGSGLNALPSAIKDVEAVKRVLQHPDMGGFDEVKPLINPDPLTMQEAIQALFLDRCTKDDLVLLFFSGHGIKDERGKLYFATHITRKNSQGELVKATAVPASFVQEIMSDSRSKRQVVILDCCFSGAFAEGWSAKDDGSVNIQAQLGGEGRAVLTSSTSTQYSFEQKGLELSTYTHYFVEGIETGAADSDGDGEILVEDVHEYAKKKVQEAAPAMKPEIYAIKEGYKILIAKPPHPGDPKLRYRQEVERCIHHGKISDISRRTLNELRDWLQLSIEEATTIEDEVLKPHRIYLDKLVRYEQTLVETIQREHLPLNGETRDELKHFQRVLGLRDVDIDPIEARIVTPLPARNRKLLIGAGIATAVILMIIVWPKPPRPPVSPPPENKSPPTDIPTSSPISTMTVKELYDRGLDKYNKKDYKGAIEDFDQVLRLDPNNYVIAYYQRGYARHKVEDYKGAMEDYTQYLKFNPNDVDANSGRCAAYNGLNKYDLAVADCSKAIKIAPQDPRSYFKRGYAYYAQGKYELAISDDTKAIELNYNPLSLPYNNRGNAYSQQSNHQKAIADFNKAIQIDPDYAPAYYNRGNSYSYLGQKQKAIQDFQKAADLYQKQGDTKDYQDALERIKKLQK